MRLLQGLERRVERRSSAEVHRGHAALDFTSRDHLNVPNAAVVDEPPVETYGIGEFGREREVSKDTVRLVHVPRDDTGSLLERLGPHGASGSEFDGVEQGSESGRIVRGLARHVAHLGQFPPDAQLALDVIVEPDPDTLGLRVEREDDG